MKRSIPAAESPKVTFRMPAEIISDLYDWAEDDPEGGAVERNKPRKQM